MCQVLQKVTGIAKWEITTVEFSSWNLNIELQNFRQNSFSLWWQRLWRVSFNKRMVSILSDTWGARGSNRKISNKKLFQKLALTLLMNRVAEKAFSFHEISKTHRFIFQSYFVQRIPLITPGMQMTNHISLSSTTCFQFLIIYLVEQTGSMCNIPSKTFWLVIFS